MREPLGQSLSTEELHGEEAHALARGAQRLIQLIDPADVRVTDPPSKERFSSEPVQSRHIIGDVST
jgi:hypothetical protein